MPSQRTKSSRKSKKNTLYEDDADAAEAVTFETQNRVTRTGKVVSDVVKVPLSRPNRYKSRAQPSATLQDNTDVDIPPYNDPSVNNSDDFDTENVLPQTHKKTQRDYILQFVDRVDDILGALLIKEAPRTLDNESMVCKHCQDECIAVWRCKDCSFPETLCRKCMRDTHHANPLHRIERWTGTYFRSADLWEVGNYLLIPHSSGEHMCQSLKFQKNFLEDIEHSRDKEEQDQLEATGGRWIPRDRNPTYNETDIDMDDIHSVDNADDPDVVDGYTDAEFERYLDSLRDNPQADIQEDEQEEGDDETVVEEADTDSSKPRYLAPPMINNADLNPIPVPTADGLDNSYVRVVHTNGIHHLAMVSCVCHGSDQLPLDLAASRLLPTSFHRIRTLFSTQLMDHFRLSNLELKASAYQFYNLIRRMTSPMAPASVVNLYNEFRRMSRLWRWMKKLKWAGFAGHNGRSALDVQKGELAIFCPACPQPGINLEENWQDDKNRWVYKRIFVADGNFKADHVRTDKPSRDIWLSEGGGMIPNRKEYHGFLKSAIEALTGAPCENTFRAIQNSLLSSSSCDVTGIVGIACARHGCYAPNALVDLFKGEQQKNVDFAFLAALKSTGVHPDQGTMIIYDIICQFIIYLLKRIGHLLPQGMKVDRAIGMFHVHAHKDECFFRYAPTFIPGAACVCGEILESLWADLNMISPAARTATLAHRAEILDDHACDSNHKKALGITKYLSRRYVEAEQKREDYRITFSNLTKSADPDAVKLWTKQILDAEAQRLDNPKVMDIYAAKRPGSHADSGADLECTPQPISPIQSWIEFALLIEEKQLDIRIRARRLINHDRLTDRVKLQKLREMLKTLLIQLNVLQREAGVVPARAQGLGVDEDILIHWADDEDVLAPGSAPVEHEPVDIQVICLPSDGTADPIYAPVELKARILQARGHLNQIRELIAERSFQYSDVVRKAPRKGVRTRGQTAAKELKDQISLHAQAYSHCRKRLIRLGADENTLKEFRELVKEDIKSSTAILNPNIPGSTKGFRLSWIWYSVNQRLGPRWILDPDAAPDADPYSLNEDADPATVLEFKRVHWLRARALYNRWLEEATLVRYEMKWTVAYFLHQGRLWKSYTESGPTLAPGVVAYAYRKAQMWNYLASIADRSFKYVNVDYKPL